MEKKDWIILILFLVFFSFGVYFALGTLNASNKSVLNYISIIGTGVTMLGFVITIQQQVKIKTVADEIKLNTEKYQKEVIKNIINWQIERILRYCETINTLGEINQIEKGCLHILKEIQDSLKDCALIYTQNSIEGKQNEIENLKELIKKITFEKNNFSENCNNKKYNYDCRTLVIVIRDIIEFLKENRTIYLKF